MLPAETLQSDDEEVLLSAITRRSGYPGRRHGKTRGQNAGHGRDSGSITNQETVSPSESDYVDGA